MTTGVLFVATGQVSSAAFAVPLLVLAGAACSPRAERI
jgi:hypothetical protein